jgi:hypothetical protein
VDTDPRIVATTDPKARPQLRPVAYVQREKRRRDREVELGRGRGSVSNSASKKAGGLPYVIPDIIAVNKGVVAISVARLLLAKHKESPRYRTFVPTFRVMSSGRKSAGLRAGQLY